MVTAKRSHELRRVKIQEKLYNICRFQSLTQDYQDIQACFSSIPIKAIIQRYRYKIRLQSLFRLLDQTEYSILIYKPSIDNLIGWGELLKNHQKKNLEIGFIVHPTFWRLGIGSYIANRLVEIATQQTLPGIQQCVAYVQGHNPAARRIMDRIVKNYEGTRILDRIHNTIKYSIPFHH